MVGIGSGDGSRGLGGSDLRAASGFLLDSADAGATWQPSLPPSLPPASCGYWVVAADGSVFSFGNAAFHGSASGHTNQPVVGAATDPARGGYWLAAEDGGVFGYGSVAFMDRLALAI